MMADIDKWASAQASAKKRPTRHEAKLEDSAEMRHARHLESLANADLEAERKARRANRASLADIKRASSSHVGAAASLG